MTHTQLALFWAFIIICSAMLGVWFGVPKTTIAILIANLSLAAVLSLQPKRSVCCAKG